MENKPYIILEYNDNLEEILLNKPEYEHNEIFNFKDREYITLINKEYNLQQKKEREIFDIKLKIKRIEFVIVIAFILLIILSYIK